MKRISKKSGLVPTSSKREESQDKSFRTILALIIFADCTPTRSELLILGSIMNFVMNPWVVLFLSWRDKMSVDKGSTEYLSIYIDRVQGADKED